MDDGVFGTFDAFKSAADEILAALHQNLDGHIWRNAVVVNQVTAEIKISLAGRWETDLNFLEAHFHQAVPHAHFALMAHGFDEALVAIAQIHAAPDGRLSDLGRRPFTVRQIDWHEGLVFMFRIDHHDGLLL